MIIRRNYESWLRSATGLVVENFIAYQTGATTKCVNVTFHRFIFFLIGAVSTYSLPRSSNEIYTRLFRDRSLSFHVKYNVPSQKSCNKPDVYEIRATSFFFFCPPRVFFSLECFMNVVCREIIFKENFLFDYFCDVW